MFFIITHLAIMIIVKLSDSQHGQLTKKHCNGRMYRVIVVELYGLNVLEFVLMSLFVFMYCLVCFVMLVFVLSFVPSPISMGLFICLCLSFLF